MADFVEAFILKKIKESANMNNFNKTVIGSLDEYVFELCPYLQTELELCQTNEDAYRILQAAKTHLDKQLNMLKTDDKKLVDELHKYNQFKDMAQTVIGTLAHLQGTTLMSVHQQKNLPMDS